MIKKRRKLAYSRQNIKISEKDRLARDAPHQISSFMELPNAHRFIKGKMREK